MKHIIKKLKDTKHPRFIFSYRYFLPNLAGPIALHRKLFFLSLKKPSHLLISVYGYIRWISVQAWIVSYKATLKHHNNTMSQPKHVLFLTLLKLSLIHHIAPRYYFKYKLYKPHNKKHIFNYFYNAELPYFHDYTNKNFAHYKKAQALISDKQRFAEALHAQKIPCVLGKVYDTEALKKDPSLLLSQKTIFCKPLNGSQSIDAFLVVYDENTLSHGIKPIKTADIYGTNKVRAYLNTVFSRHHALLIQPFIEDNPEMQALSGQIACTTVRIITTKSQGKTPTLLYLQLEIPRPKTTTQTYSIYPLTLDTLDIAPTFQTTNKIRPQDKPYPIVSDALKEALRKAIRYCTKAHLTLLDLNSVSFDVILSKNGPVILEANYNWSVETLYQSIDITSPEKHPAKDWLNHIVHVK
ncbi:MAG: hypothetical protein P1U32_07115 [Legionellaceae bacterium]|nr:hypothetical protein [Legionellaceae bacterium]